MKTSGELLAEAINTVVVENWQAGEGAETRITSPEEGNALSDRFGIDNDALAATIQWLTDTMDLDDYALTMFQLAQEMGLHPMAPVYGHAFKLGVMVGAEYMRLRTIDTP